MNRRHFLTGLAAALPAASLADPLFVGRGSRQPAAAPEERPLCVFTKHLQFLDYEATAETAARIGFDGVDIPVRPGGHVLPEDVKRDLPRAVKAMRAAGLEVPMITTAIASVNDPHAEDVLRTAADLGVRYYRMNWVPYDEEAGILESLKAYRPKLRRLAALNEELGLHGAYQNHAGTHMGAPVWDLRFLLDELNPHSAGVQYDIRHATVEGGNSWPLGMRLLAPHIKTTVVKDFVWEERGGEWHIKNVPIGEGMVDFARYYDLIRELRIVGPVSIHYEYELPGEESDDVETRRRRTADVMKRDLDRVRGYLQDAGL